jgi:hypothetical protein
LGELQQLKRIWVVQCHKSMVIQSFLRRTDTMDPESSS